MPFRERFLLLSNFTSRTAARHNGSTAGRRKYRAAYYAGRGVGYLYILSGCFVSVQARYCKQSVELNEFLRYGLGKVLLASFLSGRSSSLWYVFIFSLSD